MLKVFINLFFVSFLLSFDGDTHDFYLSNGLKVIIQENHSFPRVAINVVYDIGGHDDPIGKKGLASVMGYLMWQGSANYNKDEHHRLIETTGGWSDHNKWNIYDLLRFGNDIPADQAELVFKLESDRMKSLIINLETVSNAKKSAINWLEEQQNRLWWNNQVAISSLWPKDHPYSFSEHGIIENIKNISIEDCQVTFDKYFTPNNAILVIVGDVDPINSLEQINKYFGNIMGSSDLPVNPDLSLPKNINHTENVLTLSSELPQKMYFRAYSIPSMRNEDSMVFELLDLIFDDKSSSYRQFFDNKKYVINSGSWLNEKLGDGYFIFIVSTNTNLPVTKTQKDFSKYINKLKKEGIDKENINIAKKGLLRRHMYENYWTSRVARALGEYEMLFGDYKKYSNQLELIKGIENDDIIRIANKYFIDEKEIELQPEIDNFFKHFVYSLYYSFF